MNRNNNIENNVHNNFKKTKIRNQELGNNKVLLFRLLYYEW